MAAGRARRAARSSDSGAGCPRSCAARPRTSSHPGGDRRTSARSASLSSADGTQARAVLAGGRPRLFQGDPSSGAVSRPCSAGSILERRARELFPFHLRAPCVLKGRPKQGTVRPTPASAGPFAASREFSAETMGELLRALHTRASDHPHSPGLIASWPRVPENRMAAACAQLRRHGHAVHEVSIARTSQGQPRSGWAVGGTTYRAVVTATRPVAMARHDAVLVREVAEPGAVALARAALTRFALGQGAPETVRTAVALAVSEACTNVVMHAYLDADAPGEVEVHACVDDAVLFVEVADDGRGMVPRLDSPGVGIGLPLIAEMTDAFEVLDRPQRSGVVLRMHFNLAPHRSAAHEQSAMSSDQRRSEDAIRALVLRLSRPHRSGGAVIERAAILAEGGDSAAILECIAAHAGEPEPAAPAAPTRGLYGSGFRGVVPAPRGPARYVPAGRGVDAHSLTPCR